MRRLAASLSLCCCIALTPTSQAGASKPPQITIGPVASGQDGMVVTSNSDAARVGAEVLAQGGNAVDAAIAMMFALNVSEPPFSGIGGGGFMMIYEAESGEATIIDSRERAPASATPDMFLVNGVPIPFATRRKLGIAVGVPGALAGAQAALDLFGTWSLKKVIAPAVELAEHGVLVTQLLDESIALNQALLAENEAASAVFLPGGAPLKAGDLLIQPDLADTFRILQNKGIDAFYSGEIGEDFVEEVQSAPVPGGMTMADLANYELTLDDPVRGAYGDFDLVSAAPPTSGGLTVLQTLALLDEVNLVQYANDPVRRDNLILQALQLAFADRNAYLGDPEFVPIPFAGWLAPEYIVARAELLDPDLYPNIPPAGSSLCPFVAGPVPGSAGATQSASEPFAGQTTHFTVADDQGNLVAFTTTIEQVFGTGRMLPGRGFLLNNELTDFSPTPGGPNEVQPFKRPLSSIAPTLVLHDDEPVMTIGSPGGPRIIGSIVQVLINIIDLGLDPQTAIALPRLFSSTCSTPSAPNNVRWDPQFPASVKAGLEALGYKFEPTPQEVGNVNMIRIGDSYMGIADPRREGVAIGLTNAGAKPK